MKVINCYHSIVCTIKARIPFQSHAVFANPVAFNCSDSDGDVTNGFTLTERKGHGGMLAGWHFIASTA